MKPHKSSDEKQADSPSARMICSAAGMDETRSAQPTQEDADEILLDVWEQWSYPARDNKSWAGGLSTLEWVQQYLTQRGR